MNIKLYISCSLLSIIILFVDLSIPLGVAGGVPYISVVLLSLWSSKKRITFFFAIMSSILTIAGFFFSPAGGELWKVIFNRSLALFAIWVTTALTLQRKIVEEKRLIAVKERENALEDVKILRGLLAICSSCKKIRDDNGFWKQIEEYIETNSDAFFSHGLCPDCEEKLYGNEVWFKK